jgi:primosomal protein N'
LPVVAVWVDVLVDIESRGVDRLFSYAVPALLSQAVVPGVRVLVPFGPRRVVGYVVDRTSGAEPPAPLREVIEVLDREPVFSPELWQLALWLAERYLCPRAPVLHCMLPPVLRSQGESGRGLSVTFPPGELAAVCASLKRATAQAACLAAAVKHPGLTRAELARSAGVAPQVVAALLARGLLAPAARVAPSFPAESPHPDIPVLTADQAAATWCFVGRWAETHPDLVREIVAAGRADPGGFTYCNHGYRDHGWALLGEPQALASIAAADGVITDLTGQTPRYFSPHRGEWNPAVLAASRASGHELVLWSLDTIDWKNPTASSLRVRIGHRVKAGDIVLMHPTAPTAEALAGMIQAARAKGLTLITLDRLLSPRRGPWDGGVG